MNYISYTGAYSKKKINFHTHNDYEVYIYSSGNGKLHIGRQVYTVEEGMIVVVPPNILHGSISHDNLRYIAILCKSDELIHIDTPIVFKDNERGDGLSLMQMIFASHNENLEYFNSLCLTFINFVLKNVKITTPIEKIVNKIKRQMILNFHDSEFSVSTLLIQSGYSEDYIRAQFKKIVGKTPIEYLTELRIKHAKTLINIYRKSIPLNNIAFSCGFDDYIYFSRKFKQVIGVSPSTYEKSILTENIE